MKHFKETEFKQGNKLVFSMMDKSFLLKLDELREQFDYPIIITSSYRTKEYNDKVGGAPRSMHCLGKAVDIRTSQYTGHQRWKLIGIAKELGLTIGMAKTFAHLDNRDIPVAFGY